VAQGVGTVRSLFFQTGAEQRRWQALTLANSAVAALQHATGDLRGADVTTTAVRRPALSPIDGLSPTILKKCAPAATS